MAGGSRIVISDDGITISAGGNIVYQAGQHKFEGAQRVSAEIPQLPLSKMVGAYSHRLDLSNLYDEQEFSKVRYFAFKENDSNSYISGNLDTWGRTQRLVSEEADKYKVMIFDPDERWEIIINDTQSEQ